MKVLYVTNSGGWGGASIALKNIWEQLDSSVDVFVIFPNKGEFSEFAEKKFKCFFLSYGHDIWPQLKKISDYVLFCPKLIYRIISNHKSYKHLCKIINTIQPDIVHTNVGPIHFAAKAAAKCKIPHIWHLREYQIADFNMHPFPTLKSFKTKLNLSNNYIISITNNIKNYFILSDQKCKTIYDGVIYKHKTIPIINYEDSNYLLFVGRLEDAKGWKDALKAYLKISNDYPDIELYFAGTYNKSEIEYVQKKLIPDKIHKKIKFLGFRDDCYQLMQKARALLVPSQSEGFGFITVEGMYNGCIVIGRNVAGTKEQFDNGLNIHNSEIALRFNSQEEFVNQIKNVLDKPKINYKKMIENAQQTVIKLYTIEKKAEEVLALYKSIIK